jgi:hypothetical protein
MIDWNAIEQKALKSPPNRKPHNWLTKRIKSTTMKMADEIGKEVENEIQQATQSGLSLPSLSNGGELPSRVYKVRKEEPIDRVICLLVSQGYTDSEISEKIGIPIGQVAQTKKQPWAQEIIKKLLDAAGSRVIKSLLNEGALDSAKLLVKIVRDEKAPLSLRAKEANGILDRIIGSAPIVTINGNVDLSQMSDAELSKLAAQDQVIQLPPE